MARLQLAAQHLPRLASDHHTPAAVAQLSLFAFASASAFCLCSSPSSWPTSHSQRNPLNLPVSPVLKFIVSSARSDTHIMLFSKEYVGYLARQTAKRLQDNHFIQTHELEKVIERVQSSMVEELSLEDRINDEVRVILEAYSDEMRKSAANYQEMFKRVKNELVKKYKAVL